MSNRRNGVKNKRIKQIARDMRRSVPHGVMLGHKRRKASKLRQRNLSSATRHLTEMIRHCKEGLVGEDRAVQRKKILVHANPYAAALLEKQLQSTVELALSIR